MLLENDHSEDKEKAGHNIKILERVVGGWICPVVGFGINVESCGSATRD